VEIESDLRVTSDRMLRTLDQLAALETEKRALTPGTPRFQRLADEVERLAADVFAQTHAQRQLGEQAQVVSEHTGVALDPIAETTATRDPQAILADWRDAERRLQLAAPDSAEHAAAAADVGRLRDEYHAAYAAGAQDSSESERF
jgi:hypothetical protein